MNYLWIAIPSIVIEEIGPKISEDYGIIEIDVGKVASIWRSPSGTSASNKGDIYQEALLLIQNILIELKTIILSDHNNVTRKK